MIAAISFSHLLNDMMQSVLLAIYPLLKLGLDLSFAQIGLITLTYQFTGSLLQPLIGPAPISAGPCPTPCPSAWGSPWWDCSLSQADSFGAVLLSAMLIGMGSSVFHPESSWVARMAAGSLCPAWPSRCSRSAATWDRPGPLLAALDHSAAGSGQRRLVLLFALVGVVVLVRPGAGRQHGAHFHRRMKAQIGNGLSRRQIGWSLAILGLLDVLQVLLHDQPEQLLRLLPDGQFGLSLDRAQLHLFAFLFAVAAGTVLGGPVGDRIGRKRVIWISILGVAPSPCCCPMSTCSGPRCCR